MAAGLSHYEEMWSRNADVIAPREQDALQASRILCAGCGTVGASVAEPLARMGMCSFILADPECFELSNMNRQMCVLADVGRPKVDVVADRLAAINPAAEVTRMTEGLTPQNVAQALDGVTIVFEGVDAFVSLWVKYLVHREAARRRIPVLSGVDYGGQPVVYVWDYRRDPRPFYGKATEEDHREGRVQEALAWLGYRQMPTDFIPVIVDRLTTGSPWPQVAYCAAALGALGSRTVIDILCGRPVRDIVKINLHDLTRTSTGRLAAQARWPLAAARALALVRGPLPYRPRRDTSRSLPWPELPEGTLTALNAMRLAPSVHNTQPWLLGVTDASTIQLHSVRSRTLKVIDARLEGAHYSLGCSIEAAATVAEVDFEHAPPETLALGDSTAHARANALVGTLSLGDLRTGELPRAVGLLRWRRTNRAPFATDSLEPAVLDRLADAAARHQLAASFLTDHTDIGRIGALTSEATIASLEDEAELDELLQWIRIGPKQATIHGDGFTKRTLQIDPATARLVAVLKRNLMARRLASRAGLARIMAKQSADALRASGALMLLTHEDASPAGCINAGRGMFACWLAATELNIAWQPVNQALVLQRRSDEVLTAFGAEHRWRALAIVRLGRALRPAPPSPCLPLHAICRDERTSPHPADQLLQTTS